MIKKIVLTGGPCAGKTTALARIEQDLTERGYKVFVVAESATELIKGGISPVDKNGIGMYEFQKVNLINQINKENLVLDVANIYPCDKKVIIYDRGLLDNKSYVNEDEFNEILSYVSKKLNVNLTEVDIINRYDMVMHLVTAAAGDGKNYTTENNNARYENAYEARMLDKKTMENWIMHSNLQIIDNAENFEDKISNILNTIHNFLGEPESLKCERKYLINNSFSLDNLNYKDANILQYYIKSNDKYERRLRRVEYKDGTNYYYSIYKKERSGIKNILLERRISKKEFEDMVNCSKIVSIVNKNRYSFVYNNQYFKLDCFDGFCLLEVVNIENNKFEVPKGINIIMDVTDNINYQNINLGNSLDECVIDKKVMKLCK